MFLDAVTIEVVAGRGGRGSVSFRREKYVPNGGPDGGDGGHGGDVILVATPGETTLSAFRDRRRFRAQHGGDGRGQNRTGADGDDCTVEVPLGTVVQDTDSHEILADLDRAGATCVVATGGRGGRGNVRFASSTRQAPRIGELGEKGQQRNLHLELKLIADIGLVGLPNAGKSTLLAALTGARPKIAAYPFTTLHPNLGVADIGGVTSVVIADVPGLIEGAHRGVGLGIDFLRHLERTRVLVHVVDASEGVEGARQAITDVEHELREFSPELAAKPTVIAFNKVDIDAGRAAAIELVRDFPGSVQISAIDGEGCEQALRAALALVTAARTKAATAARPTVPSHRVYRYERQRQEAAVAREGDDYRVHHAGVEKLVERTDLNSEEAVVRLQRRMRTVGIDAALARAGCVEGDTVHIGDAEFLYHDDGTMS